jgi:hypothetical protein
LRLVRKPVQAPDSYGQRAGSVGTHVGRIIVEGKAIP